MYVMYVHEFHASDVKIIGHYADELVHRAVSVTNTL
jgi:hypothetical protein